MLSLNEILKTSASRHSHLCPRQVLGARIGLAGVQAVGFEPPVLNKRLMVILETGGCFADGIQAATGCTLGHRMLRIEDYGKVAATFIDLKQGKAVRVAPKKDARERAAVYTPEETRHYFAQLAGYQTIPDEELLSFQEVCITIPMDSLLGRPGVRVNCELCGEEVINGREVQQAGMTLCLACAQGAYYQTATIEVPIAVFNQILLGSRRS